MRVPYFSLVLLPLLLCSCGIFKSSHSPDAAGSFAMVSLNPTGESTWISASSKVRLSYPFSLGEHEVTQGEYQSLMGTNPIKPTESNYGLNKPVTQVSFFDAVLFCNAASKSLGLDTVYSYSAVSKSPDGVTGSIESLLADYRKNGYRLPTEAEWDFAAKDSTKNQYAWSSDTSKATQYAWISNNANDSLHTICTKEKTGKGFCDLAGNAMEWVDGWMGPLPIDTATDYVGQSTPNSGQERIAKGGHYQAPFTSTNTWLRSDIYPLYSTSRTSYIGFRIARGVIAKPQFLQGTSASVASGTPARLIATRNQIRSFFGSTQVKLVFVNGTNDRMTLVDYSNSAAMPIEKDFGFPVRHPKLSPNGAWIAFTNLSKGQGGLGKTWITRATGVDTASLWADSVTIPVWSITPLGDTNLIMVSSAAANGDSLTWAKSFTNVYRFDQGSKVAQSQIPGAYYNGRSSNGRFFVSSYTSLRVYDQDSAQVKTLFQSPENGKTPSGSTQTCNASTSPGSTNSASTNRILFLDFGYADKSSLVGRPYAAHEFIFFMNPATGQVTDTLQVPSPYTGWDFTEWSTHPEYVVASVTDGTDMHKAIYAIRTTDHAMLKLAEGDDVLMPHLFIPGIIPTGLEIPDSIFMYNEPGNSWNEQLGAKMMRYWSMRDSLQILVIGSSRTMNGVNTELFAPLHAMNFSMSGMDQWSSMIFFNSYMSQHSPQIKWLVLDLSLDFLYCTLDTRWNVRWSLSEGYQYDKSQQFYAHGFPRAFDTLLQISETPRLDNVFTPTGFAASPSAGWGSNLDYEPATFPLNQQANWSTTLDSIEAFFKQLEASGIRIIGVIPPQDPQYITINEWGRYGPSLDQAKVIMQRINGLESKHSNFRLLDQHKFGQHDYNDSDALNNDHLSSLGAVKLTTRIDSVMKAWGN